MAPSCRSNSLNVKSLLLSMLPLTGDHSENTMWPGFSPTVLSVKASPQMMFRSRMNLTASRHASLPARFEQARVV